ncbi:cation-transporting P-type ATPase [Bauldia sp.]|uniref:cation-transporting P-type ATPase n=1 Tax=Bauldia sp. TaxID=2575872 RepID=UPI003BAC34A9
MDQAGEQIAPVKRWFAEPAEVAYQAFATGPGGLSTQDAERRLATHGPNRLPEARPRGALARFVSQFANLLIYVLLAAAVVSALLGEWIDAAVILAVVIANAIVGYLQEGRAERALDAIRKMITPAASVLRDGGRLTVPAETLVTGDIVLLEAGDRLPADLRLVKARHLRIEEAALTGESLPVDKGTQPVAETSVLGDRTSMAYSGTLVVAGQAAGVVVATGQATELGTISILLDTLEPQTTPLIRQMDRFARLLTVVILSVAVAGFAFAVLVRGYAMDEAFMAMVGLVVAAIPEGLPAVMTITLAIGVQRMARRNAIIRRLPAVETLGSVSVICTDKTGTLTRNEMTVRTVVTAGGAIQVSGVGYAPEGGFSDAEGAHDAGADSLLQMVGRAAVLCNDADLRRSGDEWIVAGDPMEGALVSLAAKAGLDQGSTRQAYPRLDEIPFDSRHRFMATLNEEPDGGRIAYIKGAPERLLALCDYQEGEAGPEPIDRPAWLRAVDAMADDGQRVLAVGMKRLADNQTELEFSDLNSGVVFLGALGMIDPPRPDAKAAIDECRTAGIGVKMITGDHASTAAAIGRQLGLLDHEKVTTGEALETVDTWSLPKVADETAVFARTSPEQKLSIVEALQSDAAIAAMTGDGVNDAPALKRADVGIAMGQKGTEAAKEAAEMVLLDDNFASIVAAVREGRTVYDNLKKVIAWTLPTSGGEAIIILFAILAGFSLPVTPVQILWINMVTVVALGLTLAFEPTEPGAMTRPPRRADEPILSGVLIWQVVLVSLLFVVGSFGVFFYALDRGLDLAAARTMVVNTIVVMEVFYLFSVRYLYMTSFSIRGIIGTPAVMMGVGAVVIAQFAFTYAPFMQAIFDTQALDLIDGLVVVGAGIALFVLLEVEKAVRGRLVG